MVNEVFDIWSYTANANRIPAEVFRRHTVSEYYPEVNDRFVAIAFNRR